MGIFDLFPADPNIDNPKRFVIYIVVIILILVVLIGGYRIFANWNAGSATADSTPTATSTTLDTGNTGTVRQPTSGKGTASKGGVTVPVTYDVLISYTDQGFSPATLQIKAGTSVRFINKSGGTMRVMSVKSSNASAEYSDLTQSQSVGRGGTYDFNFTRRGTWLYENLNNPTKTGVVVVN